MALIFTLEFVLKTVVYFFLSLNILGRDHSFSTHAKSTNSINMIDWVPRTQYCAARNVRASFSLTLRCLTYIHLRILRAIFIEFNA